MTDSLKKLTGDAIRAALVRFTSSPLTGAATGAVSTALLQSSSATTVAAIGFVGAGLLGFSEALGIIFGANLGTTVTGWLVALLGLKLQLGTVVLPLVFVGAALVITAKPRLIAYGYAIAGFSLIFIGISTLQEAMSGIQTIITPEFLSVGPGFLGRLKLVLIGIAVSAITQSSSAGVAATLTALFAGAISFEQAAVLIIGMDIGTTFTAAMATIGGTVGSRRTGFSHVIFNLFTGIGALLIVTPFIYFCNLIDSAFIEDNAEIALVTFHTLFNLLSIVIVLPFAENFARLIKRIFPEELSVYAEPLEPALLEQPDLALNAVQKSTKAEFIHLLGHVNSILSENQNGGKLDLTKLQISIDHTQSYLDKIHISLEEKEKKHIQWERLIGLIHTLDHLQRLHERCEEEEDRAITAREKPELKSFSVLLVESINKIIGAINNNEWSLAVMESKRVNSQLYDELLGYRKMVINNTGTGEFDVPLSTDYLESIRWLRRVSKHITRITEHFSVAMMASGK